MTGEELHQALKGCGLSIAQAARDLDVSYTTLWHQVKGNRPVTGPIAAAVLAWIKLAELEAYRELKEDEEQAKIPRWS